MTTLSKEDVVRTDNDLLAMIQKHFPSLPLDDRYTDWGKWLRFAKAVYSHGEQAARADLVAENERLKARLEVADHGWDGISCRDETIKLQDSSIKELRTALAAAEAREEKLHGWMEQWCKFDSLNMDLNKWLDFGEEYRSLQRDDSVLREMIAGVYDECAKVADLFEQKADALNSSIADDDDANEGRSEYIMGKATASSRIAKAIRALAEKAKGK